MWKVICSATTSLHVTKCRNSASDQSSNFFLFRQISINENSLECVVYGKITNNNPNTLQPGFSCSSFTLMCSICVASPNPFKTMLQPSL
jgi:hypothetical protein